MRRGWVVLLVVILAGLVWAQTPLTDRTGVIVRPNNGNFSGTCATRQVGMAGSTGATFMCVAGTWRRQDLAQCLATDVAGAQCTYSSLCINRTEGAIYVCNSSNIWQQISGGGGTVTPGEGEFNYSQAFSTQTAVLLSHDLGTPNVLVSCYDASDIQIYPDTVDIGTADPWDVTVTFELAQTGRCVVNGSGNGTTGGGGDPGTGGFTDLREDGAARVNDAEYIDFLSGFDVTSLGAVSLDYAEKPVNLGSSEVAGTLSIAKGGTGNTSFTSNTCVRYDGTRMVSAATDCGGSIPGGSCVDINNNCLADNAENVTCPSGCVQLGVETVGVLPAGQGGVGMTLAYPDSVIMGVNSATWGQFSVPDCDSSTEKLMYDRDDTGPHPNQWYCGTDYYDASGSPPQGPEGAVQFYEGGALGSNSSFVWAESTTLLRVPKIEATNFYRGSGAYARFDVDRDDSYDAEFGAISTTSYYLGFPDYGSYISWPSFAIRSNGSNYLHLDFTNGDGTNSPKTEDFCIYQNGIDSDCNGAIDFNPVPTQHDVLVGNASLSFSNRSMPDCDGTGSGNALNYSRDNGLFSCRSITGGGGSWALGLDYGADGTNVQVEVDGTTVDLDPDADGTLEARVNADGSIETFGAADESGGMGSNGKLIFSADDNNNGTGEGMDWDFDGDGTYELSAAGTGTLTMTQGALIPGVCASTVAGTTITATDCNVVTFTAAGATITTINTCNAANLGRHLTLLCNVSGQTIGTGGNLKPASGASFDCAADDTWTAICDGTNWREIARSVN